MKFIFFTLGLFFSLSAFSQKQGNIWCFGNQAGLNFNGGNPVPFSGSQVSTDLLLGENQEGTACISDSSGALLFYTSGKTIWNRNNQVMQNGGGLMGGQSSTQAALIVPQPGSDSLFYVFTSDEFQSYTSPPRKGYRYSVVNMCLDSSMGGVDATQKNIFLADSATEKLSACRDAAGTGYWIVGHKLFTSQFVAWHLNASGITATVTSEIGIVHGFWPNTTPPSWNAGSAQGQMKISPAGTKLALVIGNYQPAVLDLFDFNNSTGMVTNACHMTMDSAMSKSAYGLEFSPDGTKLYVDLSGGSGGNLLYQYDLNAGSCNAVRTSSTLIYQTTTSIPPMIGMQLATDNKIYVVSGASLSVISSPNTAGVACNFMPGALTPVNNAYSLPSFIAGFAYTNKLTRCGSKAGLSVSSTANPLCAGQQATLTASGSSMSYTWSTGAVSPSIVVSPTVTTSYTVNSLGGGFLNSVITVNVFVCTGLEQLSGGDFYLKLFPNPGKGLVNVESTGRIDAIEVLDQFGTVVYQSVPGTATHVFELEHQGLYVIRVHVNNGVVTQKLVISH